VAGENANSDYTDAGLEPPDDPDLARHKDITPCCHIIDMVYLVASHNSYTILPYTILPYTSPWMDLKGAHPVAARVGRQGGGAGAIRVR
jgi:hypothetical protein